MSDGGSDPFDGCFAARFAFEVAKFLAEILLNPVKDSVDMRCSLSREIVADRRKNDVAVIWHRRENTSARREAQRGKFPDNPKRLKSAIVFVGTGFQRVIPSHKEHTGWKPVLRIH
jgi:hypothetical protein